MSDAAMKISDLNERAIETLGDLINDIRDGKVIVDRYREKNDNIETTKKKDTCRTYAFTGVSHVEMRLIHPERVEEFRETIEAAEALAALAHAGIAVADMRGDGGEDIDA